jgi:hypothetical protein
MVDHGHRRRPKLTNAAAAPSSPQLHQNEEEDPPVLIEVFADR